MLEKQTIGDSAYEQIKYDIIHLNFAPGEKLSEASLSRRYNVSRAPIRVALGRLKEDGLIDIRPQSGSIVCPISIERAVSIVDVRLLLEPYAVRQALPHLSDEDILRIEKLFHRLDQMEPGSTERSLFISEVDIELHGLIHKRSGNPIIPEIINRYAGEIQRIRRANIEWKNRMTPSEQEMRRIFAALKERNVDASCEAMRIHLLNIRDALLHLPAQS